MGQFTFEVLGHLNNLIGLAGTVFALLAWLKARQVQREACELEKLREQPIQITLVGEGGKELKLPYRPRRDQLTRAEVAGVLGMYAGRRRYDLPGLAVAYESGHFGDVLAGRTSEFRINSVPTEEFTAFETEVATMRKEEQQ